MDKKPTSQRLAEELSKLKPRVKGLNKIINRARAGNLFPSAALLPEPVEGAAELVDQIKPADGYQYLDLTEAKAEVVQPITEAAFAYLVDLINSRQVDLADAIMIGHNLHCWLIQSLEQSAGLGNQQKLELRRIALSTFARAMEDRP